MLCPGMHCILYAAGMPQVRHSHPVPKEAAPLALADIGPFNADKSVDTVPLQTDIWDPWPARSSWPLAAHAS